MADLKTILILLTFEEVLKRRGVYRRNGQIYR